MFLVPEFKKKKQNPSINKNDQVNYSSASFKPSCKGRDLMQCRLEAIKSNKKFSKMTSFESNSITSQESIKYFNNSSKTVSPQTFIKNHDYSQFHTNHFKPYEYQKRSAVRKHSISEIDHHHNTLTNHYTEDVTSSQSK